VQLSRNRVEALTDGVFAVAMTLLVLDIKVPELQAPSDISQLAVRLLALWPKFLSYTISFVILGVYLVGHHVQLSFIRKVDRPLLWINLLFLLWVALVPFSTALLSEYPMAQIAITLYGLNLIAIGLTLALHWWYATVETKTCRPGYSSRARARRPPKNADRSGRLRCCHCGLVLPPGTEFASLRARSLSLRPSRPGRCALG
jgi:uncharacterized membrane protein